MTLAKQIKKLTSVWEVRALIANEHAIRRQLIDYGIVRVFQFQFIDGSILTWRVYL